MSGAARPSILLVGCGGWGRHILRDLVAIGCDVAVVARSDASVARARDGGAHCIVSAIGEAPRAHGVVVCVPTTLHEEVISQTAPLGVPVFTEKPLTADRAGARRLEALMGERLFVMDKWRYHPGVIALRDIARSGELGAVVGVRTTRVGWMSRQLDVDAVWHLAPHDLSIGLETLGEIPAPRAAVVDTHDGEAHGMTALLGDNPYLMIDVSERRRRHFREVRLICENGWAVLPDSYSNTVLVTRDAGAGEPSPVEARPIAQDMPLRLELEAFVDHVRGGPPPKSSAAEAVAIVEAVEDLRALAGLKP